MMKMDRELVTHEQLLKVLFIFQYLSSITEEVDLFVNTLGRRNENQWVEDAGQQIWVLQK